MEKRTETDQLLALVDQTLNGRMSRREALRRALALGLGATAFSALLAACGGGESTATATTRPAGGTSLTPPTSSGAGGVASPAAAATTRVAGTPGGKIALALESDLSTLDPHKSTAAVDRQVFQLVFNKLVDIDEKLNVVPQLASKWEISNEGKTYTFTLVEGVKFHDGTDCNAEAVKVNFERMLNRETASPRRGEIEQVTKVEAPDAKTVVLTLSQPYAPLLATLSDRAGMIISPKAIADKGNERARQAVGTGAFAFVE